MSWSTRSTRPDIWELCWTDKAGTTSRVGECCWIRLPIHPAVAMQRIVDRLNSESTAYDDRLTDDVTGWWCQIIASHPEQKPVMWVAFYHQDVEAMVLVWDRTPTSLARWHSRLVAALHPIDGLPEVALTEARRAS